MKTKFKETEIGMIPEDWEMVTIPDIASNFDNKRKPLSSAERSKMKGQYPYYGAAGIIDYVNGYKYDGDYLLIAEDGTVTCDGFKPMLQLPRGKFWVSNHAHVLQSDSYSDTLFLYYQLKNTSVNAFITGAVQPKLSQENLNKIKFPWVKNDEERGAITKILSDIDSKIELNHQINKTLEAMSQALFKRWFVDFEFPNEKGKPYKSSAGEMIDSELGEIPRGWQVDNATKLFTLEYGWHLPKWDRQEGDVPVFGSGGLTGYHNSHFVEGPGVIIGRAGKVGSESVYYSHLNFCPIETTFYILAENKRIIRYLYFFLKTLETVNTGSSVPNLSRRDIHSAKIIISDVKVIEAFDKIVKTLFDQIKNNEKEIDYSSQIRDSLLPRLMSGKIRVEIDA